MLYVPLRKFALNGQLVKLKTRRYVSAGLEMLQQWRVSGELFRTAPAVDTAWEMS